MPSKISNEKAELGMEVEEQPIQTRVVRMKLSDLKLLELNARYMRHETFATLVRNLKRDKVLTSAPFACLDEDGRYLVLSGNHRVMAAIEAGIEEADVVVTDDDLPEQRRIAIQLSHNALTGEDDPATLKQLYDELENLDWRDYAGLDDQTLELLEQVGVGELKEAELDFATLNLVFLPDEKKRVEAILATLKREVHGADLGLARMDEYDRMLDALEQTGQSYGIKNIALCVLLILDVFERHRDELSEGYLNSLGDPLDGREKSWVPLESILNTSTIPASSASIIRQGIAKMQKAGEVSGTATWQALEHWAADYIAGPDFG